MYLNRAVASQAVHHCKWTERSPRWWYIIMYLNLAVDLPVIYHYIFESSSRLADGTSLCMWTERWPRWWYITMYTYEPSDCFASDISLYLNRAIASLMVYHYVLEQSGRLAGGILLCIFWNCVNLWAAPGMRCGARGQSNCGMVLVCTYDGYHYIFLFLYTKNVNAYLFCIRLEMI